MIVLGADTHKRSHTVVAVAAVTGSCAMRRLSLSVCVAWMSCCRGGAVWLTARMGDRGLPSCVGLVRALPRRSRRARGSSADDVDGRRAPRSRQRGKSDSIDAVAVARAAIREGVDELPARLDGPELDLRLLVDHRERLVRQRVSLNSTLQWHLHDLWPELELPGSSLFYGRWAPRIARRLARAEQTMRVRIARDELRRHPRAQPDDQALERHRRLGRRIAPQLLEEPGVGPLTAAKLVGEIAGADRFASDAKLARAASLAPIPVSSGKTNRHRLDPRRQPPDQRRHSPRRRHTRPMPSRDTRLHRSQARGGQDHPRSHPLPQAPPRPPHLAPTPAAHPDRDLSQSALAGRWPRPRGGRR